MAAVESNIDKIEIGDDCSSDSEYASTYNSETTSLSSSVFNYVYENGRRYTSDRKGAGSGYILPNDEQEQERLDLTHHAWTLSLKGELHLTPLPKCADSSEGKFSVLDLGTGTGIWAIDMGDLYPNADITGTDVSPIQPGWTPPNVHFEVDDFEETWVFRTPFDFIHGRNLVATVQDWPKLLSQSYDNLTPGGVIEFAETDCAGCYSEDGTVLPDSPIDRYNRALADAGKILGRDAEAAPKLKGYLEAAGFVDVKEKRVKWPVGVWPKERSQKELGAVVGVGVQTGVEAYALAALTRVLGWELDKAKAFMEEVVRDMSNRKIHAIYPQYVVYGRKPTEEEVKAREAEKKA